MVLPVPPPGVQPDDRQQVGRRTRIRAGMPGERLLRNRLDPDPADARRSAGEVSLDELGRQTDRLEDLCAAVGRDRRDAHLGHRLEQALRDPLHGAALGVFRGHLRRQLAAVDQLRQRLEHQVRVDRRGAVADEHGDAVHAARLAGLDDQAGLQARPLADEVMVDGRDRECRRDRRPLGPDGAVGEDQDVGAVGERVVRCPEHALESRLHPRRAVHDGPGEVERVRLEDRRVDLPQALQLRVEQDRVVDHELARMLGRLVEQVPLRADAGLHAHHDRLADRVDRRIRHLREELLEVRVEERLAVGQNCQRRVVAHRADRFLGVARQRRQDHLHVLLRVAEGELPQAQRLRRLRLRLARGKVGRAHDLLLVPPGVRLAGDDLPLDLVVLDDAAALEIDEEELARLEAPLAKDVLRRLVEHPRLRGEHDPAVLRLEPAAGPQAVAVECRADHPPVREGDRRRPVPRLDQALVVGVEALQLVGKVVPALIGLRDHHHHRVRQRTAGEHEQLEHVVEDRRVGAPGPDDRENLREVVPEEIRGELRLARLHPVDVASQRVDLAVVGDQPVRVRELPARERVGREAGVDERERHLDPLVAQIGEVPGSCGAVSMPL